jgi:hypothetical protein
VNDIKRVAIVAHDAGGAEILASYVAQNSVEYKLALDGPAVNVFKRRFGAIEVCSLEEAIRDCDWCLCGTGWQSDFEWKAIGQASQSGKRVIAFLDHWVSYQERFIRNNIQHLPDELWVGDEVAEKLAREEFPGMSIKVVFNPYFIDIKRELAGLAANSVHQSDDGCIHVLFVCENISEHAQLRHADPYYWGYTETEAIKFFLENLKSISNRKMRVVVRPHPSDAIGKYNWVIEAYPGIVELSEGRPLIQEIVDANVVVGCESMAMVVGLMAEKKVISCIPKGGHFCRLPQVEIGYLFEIVAHQAKFLD